MRRFTLWGIRPESLKKKLRDGQIRAGADALGRRLERDSGLKVVNMRSDGHNPKSGAQHFEVTFGRPVRERKLGGGARVVGHAVEGRCWAALYPAKEGS